MTNRVKLTGAMDTSPMAWQNFFLAELDDGPRNAIGDVPISYINKKLELYSAQFDETPGKPIAVVFDSEEAMSFWLLRWS